MSLNYKELAEKLYCILEYDMSRPDDICEELMCEYGRFYNNTTVYHGAFGNRPEDVLNSYSGFISCTPDLQVAESFAISDYGDHVICTVMEIKLNNIYALDVQKLINDCYINCPDDELCIYIYESYNSENELLLYYEDIENNIKFLDYDMQFVEL